MSPPADWRGGGWRRDSRRDGAVLLSESQHEHVCTKLQQLRQGVQHVGVSNVSVSRRVRDAGSGRRAVEETRRGGGQEGGSRNRGTRDSRVDKSATAAQSSTPHKLPLERLRDRNRERLVLLGAHADAGGVEAPRPPRSHTARIQDRYVRYERYAEGVDRPQTSLQAEMMSRGRGTHHTRVVPARAETPTVRGYRLQRAERDTGKSEFVVEALRLIHERNLEQSRLFNADPSAYCTLDFRRPRGETRVLPVPARPKAYSHYSQASVVTTLPAPGAASAEFRLAQAFGASSHTQQSLAPVATETTGAMERMGATEPVGVLDKDVESAAGQSAGAAAEAEAEAKACGRRSESCRVDEAAAGGGDESREMQTLVGGWDGGPDAGGRDGGEVDYLEYIYLDRKQEEMAGGLRVHLTGDEFHAVRNQRNNNSVLNILKSRSMTQT